MEENSPSHPHIYLEVLHRDFQVNVPHCQRNKGSSEFHLTLISQGDLSRICITESKYITFFHVLSLLQHVLDTKNNEADWKSQNSYCQPDINLARINLDVSKAFVQQVSSHSHARSGIQEAGTSERGIEEKHFPNGQVRCFVQKVIIVKLDKSSVSQRQISCTSITSGSAEAGERKREAVIPTDNPRARRAAFSRWHLGTLMIIKTAVECSLLSCPPTWVSKCQPVAAGCQEEETHCPWLQLAASSGDVNGLSALWSGRFQHCKLPTFLIKLQVDNKQSSFVHFFHSVGHQLSRRSPCQLNGLNSSPCNEF